MELLAAFPDAEDIGLELLAGLAPTYLATPVTLSPPLIVIRRVGGYDNKVTDIPRLQVQTFGNTHVQARDLAEACRQTILASPATPVVGVSIDQAITETAPVFVDYGQPAIHRYVGTYRLEYRRTR
jgi:hypothetical protein